MRTLIIGGFFSACLISSGLAQSQAPSPLTVEQRQAIQIKAQEMTIAQLQYEKSRAELTALMQSLQKDGFDLNLQTGEYTKKPETKK